MKYSSDRLTVPLGSITVYRSKIVLAASVEIDINMRPTCTLDNLNMLGNDSEYTEVMVVIAFSISSKLSCY